MFFRLRMPSVDVKANGSDGPISLQPGDPLEISLAFDASATAVLDPSEIYVAVVTPWLEVYWVTPGGFATTRLHASQA